MFLGELYLYLYFLVPNRLCWLALKPDVDIRDSDVRDFPVCCALNCFKHNDECCASCFSIKQTLHCTSTYCCLPTTLTLHSDHTVRSINGLVKCCLLDEFLVLLIIAFPTCTCCPLAVFYDVILFLWVSSSWCFGGSQCRLPKRRELDDTTKLCHVTEYVNLIRRAELTWMVMLFAECRQEHCVETTSVRLFSE